MSKGSIDDGVVFHAGFPNAAEDEKFGSLSLDKLVVRHPASTFFWRLDHDIPELLWTRGSVVVVDRGLELCDGSLAVIMLDGDFILAWYRDRKLVRLSGEVIDGEIAVWGIVTHCVQALRGGSL